MLVSWLEISPLAMVRSVLQINSDFTNTRLVNGAQSLGPQHWPGIGLCVSVQNATSTPRLGFAMRGWPPTGLCRGPTTGNQAAPHRHYMSAINIILDILAALVHEMLKLTDCSGQAWEGKSVGFIFWDRVHCTFSLLIFCTLVLIQGYISNKIHESWII